MGLKKEVPNQFKQQIEAEKKKTLASKEDPCPGCDLTVFSEVDFHGNQQVFEAHNSAVKTNFKDPIQSIIIKGNPWILYPEPSFGGRPIFLEEGKYKCPEDIKIDDVGSVKKVDFRLNDPVLMSYESSKFQGLGDGENTEVPWCKLGDRTMRQVAVGGAGIWGIAKDNTVWVRGNSAGNSSTGVGDNWTKLQSSPLKLISVGPNSLWGIDNDNHCTIRTEVGPGSPLGKTWVPVEGDYKSVTVSDKGHVWAVDMADRIWWRKGAKTDSPTGSAWKAVSGSLKSVCAGLSGVWGLDNKNQVWFRDGLADDPDDNEGNGWTLVDGKFINLAVSDGVVWALGSSREIFYRSGIDKNQGSHWLRVEQPKNHKIVFKQLDVMGDTLIATDKDNNIYYKLRVSNDVKAGMMATFYDDVPNFDQYSFPIRGSSYKIVSGGWVLYSEPNYQGKIIFHVAEDCLSNDPADPKDPTYKQWAAQFGSARPIRGLSYRTLILNVEPDWDKATLRFEREKVDSVEHQNDEYETVDVPWDPTIPVTTSVSHHFALNQPQNFAGYSSHLIQGNMFYIPAHDPIGFQVTGNGSPVFTGQEFHRQLENPFVLASETEASKFSEMKTTAQLPKFIQGKHKTQAIVYIYKCTANVPCKVTFKLGFLPNFDIGSEAWTDNAVLTSVDRTNVKVEISHQNLNNARKFSQKITNNGSKSL